MNRRHLLLAALLGALPRTRALGAGRRLRVASAADLRFALGALAEAFRDAERGADLEPVFGSSGSFFAQIGSGAPFDVYLSADADYPRRLVEAGLSLDRKVFLYAVGRLAVWARAGSPLDPETDGMRALVHPSVRHVAIANPAHAPYGRAAEAAMRSLGVYDAVKGRLVLGENVAQAAQFVESGAADVGVIALSLALSPAMTGGRRWVVPESAHPRLEQGGVILRSAREPLLAAAFRDVLLGGRGRAILEGFGFSLPPGSRLAAAVPGPPGSRATSGRGERLRP